MAMVPGLRPHPGVCECLSLASAPESVCGRRQTHGRVSGGHGVGLHPIRVCQMLAAAHSTWPTQGAPSSDVGPETERQGSLGQSSKPLCPEGPLSVSPGGLHGHTCASPLIRFTSTWFDPDGDPRDWGRLGPGSTYSL